MATKLLLGVVDCTYTIARISVSLRFFTVVVSP